METKYGRSKVTTSNHFKEIMDKYELVGRHMSVAGFYKDYISKMDETISSVSWQRFMTKFNQQIQLKAAALLEKIEDTRVTEITMEGDSMKKILAIADLTLDEVVKNPLILAGIPVGQRMNWLFKAMKARDSRMKVSLIKRKDDRRQDIFDDILKGAQYGTVLEGDVSQEKPEKIEAPKKEKTIIFNPEQIEQKEHVKG